ncbi:hypothetical protein P152DRAFT_446804 [Eremomyces bilateralis CBS 781.70]|uniref:Uncharacterized protein n=1 Tax=Eremomyces bilateralis CBS 781.70 TaxID=1392243 RepID=A0A6G1GD03_9PEZI|nr:uncharacterized protein P152DRAFT_446804 [Eremomyces bilateralis CBS 781.70]KAF1815786.1 hypothetical protein P152DRAFT_446804 [Eremomyces bilateralis CBS 781.70]
MYTPRSYAQYQALHVPKPSKSTTKGGKDVKDTQNHARGDYGTVNTAGLGNTMLKGTRKAPATVVRRSSLTGDVDPTTTGATTPVQPFRQHDSHPHAITSQMPDEDISSHRPSLIHTNPFNGDTVPLPSRPVVIPSRSTAAITSHPSHAHTIRARGPHGGNPSGRMPSRTRTDTSKHNPKALPPAVAALLALTSIPPPRRQSTRRGTVAESPRRTVAESPSPSNVDELIRHWREEEHGSSANQSAAPSFATSSPLDVLLEPPRSVPSEADTTADASEDEQDGDESDSDAAEHEHHPRSVRSTPSRSVSSSSIPSLEPASACPSVFSMSAFGSSMPFTPANTSSPSSTTGRREKFVNSPPSEACVDSHPLISPLLGPDPTSFSDIPLHLPALTLPDPEPPPTSRNRHVSPPPPKPRKSNLTASLSALRATRLLSAFSPSSTDPPLPSSTSSPTTEPESLLTRSPYGNPSTRRFPSEMRPRWSWSAEMPVPEPVRRYFNPAPPTSGGRLGYLRDADSTSRGIGWSGGESATGSAARRRGSSIAVQPGDVHRDANLALRAEEPAGAPVKGKMILLRTYTKTGPAGNHANHPSASSLPPPAPLSPRRKRPIPEKSASSPAPSPLEDAGRMAAETGAGQPMARPREPRENSDFLRVIVLEMNMRRVGKLDRKAGGRAKIWLPPREGRGSGGGPEEKEEKEEKEGEREKVPERWRGWSVDEEG